MRTLLSIVCGCFVALFIVAGIDSPVAAGGLDDRATSRTCYYACDTWTLYLTEQACFENCVSPCERVCF